MDVKRLLCLMGTDFCGSTLLSRLLWLCPGVAAVGEVHAYLRGDYQGCDICGRDCKLLGSPRIKYEALAKGNLYRRVVRACSAYETVVLSDKQPALYAKLLPRDMEAEAVIVYRAPWSHARSECRRERRSWDDAVQHWLGTYNAAFALAHRAFQAVYVVDFEALVSGLPDSLRDVTAELRLPEPAPVPEDLSEIPWHHVGGSKRGRKLDRVIPGYAIGEQRDVGPSARKLWRELRGRAA